MKIKPHTPDRVLYESGSLDPRGRDFLAVIDLLNEYDMFEYYVSWTVGSDDFRLITVPLRNFLKDLLYDKNDRSVTLKFEDGFLKICVDNDARIIGPLDYDKAEPIIDKYMMKQYGSCWELYTIPSWNSEMNRELNERAVTRFN